MGVRRGTVLPGCCWCPVRHLGSIPSPRIEGWTARVLRVELTELQAHALVTIDPALARKAKDLVPLAPSRPWPRT